MKKKKIVIIRGLVTAGKSTTSYELAKVLPKWIFIDVWKIKEMFEPLGLKNRNPMKEISKKVVTLIMKEVMRTLGTNIIVQESSQEFVKRHLKKELKKYNYTIYSFFLDIDFKNAIKRDTQREKPTMHLDKTYTSEDEWKKSRVQPEKEDVVINTSKHNIEEVVKIILRAIDEKKQKHPFSHALRKAW